MQRLVDQPIVHLPFATINFGINKEWYYWSVLLVVIIVIVLLRNLEHSRVGRAWVALREDEVAAAATGINTTSTKLLAFAIGASVSGLAGAFYGSIVTIVSPDDFSFSVSVSILSIIVLGGIGNIMGAVLGALIMGVAEEFVVGYGASTYRDALAFWILIVILLFKPAGLLGKYTVEKV